MYNFSGWLTNEILSQQGFGTFAVLKIEESYQRDIWINKLLLMAVIKAIYSLSFITCRIIKVPG